MTAPDTLATRLRAAERALADVVSLATAKGDDALVLMMTPAYRTVRRYRQTHEALEGNTPDPGDIDE